MGARITDQVHHEPAKTNEPEISFTLSKNDVDRLRQIPNDQLQKLGFSGADDLLNSLHATETRYGGYIGKIKPIVPIIPGGKGGDRHPGGDNPGTGGGTDWLPNPEELLDLSDEAKEALKRALAFAVVLTIVGVAISNPALLPAAARAVTVLAPMVAPRAMQFCR